MSTDLDQSLGKSLVSFLVRDESKSPLEPRNLFGVYTQTKPELKSSIFISSKEDGEQGEKKFYQIDLGEAVI